MSTQIYSRDTLLDRLAQHLADIVSEPGHASVSRAGRTREARGIKGLDQGHV